MNCPICPVPEGFKCVRFPRNHPRYCEVCDPNHPDYNEEIRADVLADSTGQPRPGRAARETPTSAPVSDEEIRLRIAVETCDFLQDCHCNGSARCLRGVWASVATTWRECLACVKQPTS